MNVFEQLSQEDSNVVFRYKLQCLVGIALVGIVSGFVPLKLRLQDRFLSLGNVLSGP